MSSNYVFAMENHSHMFLYRYVMVAFDAPEAILPVISPNFKHKFHDLPRAGDKRAGQEALFRGEASEAMVLKIVMTKSTAGIPDWSALRGYG